MTLQFPSFQVPVAFEGTDWFAVLRERRDGPRYVEAVRGAREMRQEAYGSWPNPHPLRGAFSWELDRDEGIPEGWISR